MVEIPAKIRSADLPYTLVFYDVTEEMFDELVDEDTKAELIDGVMIVHSPASMRHDNVGGFLRSLIGDYAEEKDLGLVLGPGSLVRLRTLRKFGPDIFFLPGSQVPTPLPKQWQGAPAMVVEILSPSNRRTDLKEKRQGYWTAGVKEIWFIDLDREVVIQDQRKERKYAKKEISKGIIKAKALPGFWVDAAWLWQEPLPKKSVCLQAILAGAK